MRILGFGATFGQHVDGIDRNHETADCGKEWIDQAHALVGDRSGDVHRRGVGDSGQQTGGGRGQAHRRRIAHTSFTPRLKVYFVLLSRGVRDTKGHH